MVLVFDVGWIEWKAREWMCRAQHFEPSGFHCARTRLVGSKINIDSGLRIDVRGSGLQERAVTYRNLVGGWSWNGMQT